MEEYFTTYEIAKLLKVNVMTIRRWINSGKLPATLLIKEYRIKASDLNDFLNKKRIIVKGGKK